MKITGKELKLFFADDDFWGDACLEEEIISVDGKIMEETEFIQSVPDNASVRIEEGIVIHSDDDLANIALLNFFKIWQKKQNRERLLVEVNKDKKDALIQIILANGGKII